MLGVWGVMGMLAVMAVLRVAVLVCVRGVGRVLVVLRVGRGVVVVVVVVRRRVLWDLAVVGVVAMVLGLRWVCYLCCVVQVGRVGLVGYECGVTGRGERRVALGWRFASLAAKERPKDGGRCWVRDGGMAAWCALTWRGGSPARVRTANDGPLQAGERGDSTSVRHCAQQLPNCSNKAPAGWAHSFLISDKQVAKCYRACKWETKNVFMVGSSDARNISSSRWREPLFKGANWLETVNLQQE